ncbi:MAG: phage terminase large subunit [Candidatus Thorarchaeota archaeon]
MSSAPFSLDQVNPATALRALDRADSESSLREFIKLSWPILEPGRDFVMGWHIDAVCDHLEAVTNGEITRLLINVPPGCMKSLSTEVFWPAWEWGPKGMPSTRYVSASYSNDLTVRDNRRCRNLIKSDWYQSLWGKEFNLVGDQNAKMRFDTNYAGFKIATSVGGLGTGERGDRFIIDDPHNIKDGESDAKRMAALLWFTETVPTRMNDPEKSAIVIIMQRVHDQDISGLILEKDFGYDHLMIPMEFEPDRKCFTCIGFEDPRTEDGELMWPERMTEEVLERDKKVMGEYAVASQFQQRPAPRGGGMFKKEWFEVINADQLPIGREVVRGWDLAASDVHTASYTAGVKISRCRDGFFYVEDAVRAQESEHKVERLILNTASQDGYQTRISGPQDPGQAGKAQAKYYIRQLAGFNVRFTPETGDKITRATPLAAQAEAGNVKLIRGLWNEDYLDELSTFPFGKFDDQMDASSRAFNELIPNRPLLVPVGPQELKIHG